MATAMPPRRRTVVLATAAALLALLAGTVGGVAAITRTDAGRALLRRALLPVLQAAIPGRLYVGRIGGTFVTRLTLDSLEIRTPAGRPFLATGPITVTYDPRDLLDRRLVIKTLEVTRPVVELVDYGNDDWNWRRALQRGRRPAGPRGRGFGSFIKLDTATLREMTLVVRQPWALSDTLRGAKRDSALAFNLTRLDGEIRREEGRLARVYRFTRGTLALARVRLADPDTAGQAFALRRLDVVWVLPPFWFREFSGVGRILGDTLWLDDVRFRLANSKAAGRAKAVWGSRLPMRYDVALQGDTVAFADLAWIHPTVPHAGGGATRLTIRNDPRALSVIEYALTGMDARALRSRLRGRMTYAVGGPVLAVNDVDLELRPAHTDFLRWLNGEPFPYDWRGELTGRVAGRGGPITDWQLDEARLTYDDAHVPGARTVGAARGRVNLFTPAEAILKGMDVTIAQLDLRTPRFVNPNFAEVNGLVRGTLRLDSLWYDAWFSRADLEHVDGPGQPSRFTGGGRYTLVPEGVIVDVDLQAAPLNYTMLSRSYPTLPLRGQAVGRIQAKGIGDDLAVQATLAGEGGEITFTGRADATDPRVAARGDWRLRGGNLQALFGDNRYPTSNLNMAGRADIAWEFIPDAVGTVDGVVDRFSTVNAARLFGGQFRLTFDSGHVRVDTAAVESSALRLAARGGLGLVRGRPDTLSAVVDVDSLGGWRPWVTPMDSGSAALVAPSAPLSGVATVRLQLAGTVDTLDPQGVALAAQGALADVMVAGVRAARAAVTVDVRDALRGATGAFAATADSAAVGGVPVTAMAVQATLQGGLADRFTASLRTANEARLALAGGVARQGEATLVRLDSLAVRVDSGGAPPRGLSLAAPALLALTNGGAALDSLVLVHTDTGRLTVRGALAADSTVSARVAIDRLPLGDLGRLLARPGVEGGHASAALQLDGTRERPRLRGDVALREARLGGVRLGDLSLAVQYDTLRLDVAGTLRVAGRQALEGSATLPLDLAFLPRRSRRLEAALAGRLRTVEGDLALLPQLVPSVTEARGRLLADVALTGSWARPRVRGGVRVDSAMAALGALGVRLQRVRADIGLAADTIAIRTLAAESGAPGDSLALRGTVGITEIANPTFNLTLAARAFQAVDLPRSATLVLTTTRPVTLTGSAEAPVVRGALRVDRGRVYIRALAQRRALDLAEGVEVVDTTRYGVNGLLPSAPGRLMQALRLDDLRLALGPDVWLRSPEANLKLGGGLRVTSASARDGRAPRLALADSLVVERGTYQLNLGIARPGFDVERGVVRFFGDPDLEPALDIAALHTVRETRLNSNRQDVRIRVLIGGTLDQPTLALRSADNPPLPESDMLSYLVTGEPAYALLGTPYAEQGATLALRLAGSYLSSRLAGGRFDVVQVEPTALNPGEAANLRQSGLGILASTRVGVGGQVARNTFVSLSTGLCGLAAQGSATGDPLALFAQGLGAKVERRFEHGLALSLGVEPGSSAQSCGRVGVSRAFQQTPPQFGVDLFRSWSFR
jgi:translocation and assembly module TamB